MNEYHEYKETRNIRISVLDVYGCSLNLIRTEGYEVIDFRPPAVGDIYLTVQNGRQGIVSTDAWGMGSNEAPRLILRAKPKPQVINETCDCNVTVKDIYGRPVTIPEGWRYVRFGLPQPGDVYLSAFSEENYKVTALNSKGDLIALRIIVELVK